MANVIKKYRLIINIISLAAIIVGVSLMVLAKKGPQDEDNKATFTPTVKLTDVSELQKNNSRLSATGQVESSRQVELKSQVSAKVKRINADLGDEIRAGQTIVVFDNADIYAQLLRAQAGLEAEQVRLKEIKRGARAEELRIAETQVLSAETAARDAESNLETVKNKAESDLAGAYASALASLKSAANLGKEAILAISDIQKAHFNKNDQEGFRIQEYKAKAVYDFLGERYTERWDTVFISRLKGGVYGMVEDISDKNSFLDIDNVLSKMISSLNIVRRSLEAIPIIDKLSITEKTNLITQKKVVNSQIIAVTASRNGISTQRAANISFIKSAETALNRAESALESARKQFDLVKSGATDEQIQAQEARIKSMQASVYQVQAQLAKTVINSPISGTLAVLPVRLEELVSPGQLVASVVNTKGLEIKTYIDSQNVSQISSGDKVVVEDGIQGIVSNIAPSIDPKTKKVEVKVVVSDPENSGLIVGQYVNVDIFYNSAGGADNIYIVPLRAIKVAPGRSVVYTVDENSQVQEREVALGKIIGESIEVLDGINNDMKIISSVRGLDAGQTVNIK